jgi:hypothetical protein
MNSRRASISTVTCTRVGLVIAPNDAKDTEWQKPAATLEYSPNNHSPLVGNLQSWSAKELPIPTANERSPFAVAREELPLGGLPQPAGTSSVMASVSGTAISNGGTMGIGPEHPCRSRAAR